MYNKYKNKRVTAHGRKFDSKGECKRGEFLIQAQNSGIISDLHFQVPFKIEINGVKICTYKADFVYKKNGLIVVEDFKSNATAKLSTFIIKKKLVKAVFGIDIKIISKPTDLI